MASLKEYLLDRHNEATRLFMTTDDPLALQRIKGRIDMLTELECYIHNSLSEPPTEKAKPYAEVVAT